MVQGVAKKLAVHVFNQVLDKASHHVMNAIHQANPGHDGSSPIDLNDRDGNDSNAPENGGFEEDWQREFHRYAKHGHHNNIGEDHGFVSPHGPHAREHVKLIGLLMRIAHRGGFQVFKQNMVVHRYRKRYRPYQQFRKRYVRKRARFSSSQQKMNKQIRKAHELKYADTDYDLAEGDIAYDTNIGQLLMVNIAQGASSIQRIGKKVFCESLLINGTFQGAAAVVVVRMIIARYRHTIGATPTVATLLEGGIAATGQVLAYKDLKDGKNARIIWDHVWRFSAAEGNEGGVFRKRFKIMKHIYFDGATNGIGDIDDGLIVMYVFSNALTASNASPSLTLKSRMRYRDP